MKQPGLKFALALGLTWAGANAASADPALELSGQLRPQWLQLSASQQGPLAQAHALNAQTAEPARSALQLESELKAKFGAVNASLYLQQTRPEGGPAQSHAELHELYASAEAGGWQFSAGRKLVSWDVGYAFRPNDVVAQEARRTLLSNLPDGRPLLQAEYFSAETAWSLVWVNPQRCQHGQQGQFGEEQALALRVYQRQGAADWHGFARWGAHTQASLGAAVAWVASDSLELHASARLLQHSDVWRSTLKQAGGLQPSSPWSVQNQGASQQALAGLNWSGALDADQFGLLAEAWWDGNALPAAQWQDWAQRTQALGGLAGRAPAAAVAGNLAWQAQAFGNTSLRRRNLFLRFNWTHENFQPTLDLLYTPEDGGLISTAALAWVGDRWRFDIGLRRYGGARGSVVSQLPQRQLAYGAATWAF